MPTRQATRAITRAMTRPITGFGGGGGGGPWSPASIASIIDYWVWDDTSRLKQDSAGTIAVASPGDPIGFWRGQLDVITLTQANAPAKPAFAADGISLPGNGTEHGLAAVASFNQGSPFTVGMSFSRNFGAVPGFGYAFTDSNAIWDGIASSQDNGAYVGGTVRLSGFGANAPAFNATCYVVVTYDGTDCAIFINGTKTAGSTGSNSFTLAALRLFGRASYDSTVYRQFICSAGIDDDTAALATTWLEG